VRIDGMLMRAAVVHGRIPRMSAGEIDVVA